MCKLASFDALVAESERVHKPTSYIRDLYYHDRNYLEEYSPTVFGWMLRDMGTHMFDPRYGQAIDLLNAAVKTWPDGLLYWYDGTTLTPVTAMELRTLLHVHGGQDNV